MNGDAQMSFLISSNQILCISWTSIILLEKALFILMSLEALEGSPT